MSPALFAVALAIGQGPGVPQRWAFQDTAVFNGRPVLTYCSVDLVDRPPRPLHPEDRVGPDTRYGLLPVGNHLDGHRQFAWRPNAPDGPELWLDANGDGRFGPDERHRIAAQPAEIPVTISLKTGAFARFLSRTILVRAAADSGLRYAVRGYALGRVMLAGREYAAMLTDGNANGCFDSPGVDRVGIDLDGDGQFDSRSEQFPFGTPVMVNRRVYLVRPAADGSSAVVREQPADQGAIKLVLTGQNGEWPLALSAQLISEAGELLTVSASGRAARVPVGRYAVESLSFRQQDADGRTWSYRFTGGRLYNIVVERGQEATGRPLDGLALTAVVKLPPTGVGPGQDLPVTPVLRTPAGLELVRCDVTGRDDASANSSEAEIRLEAADGTAADRARTAFACGQFGTPALRVPATAAGLHRVIVTFPSGPLAGEMTTSRDVRIVRPLKIDG